METAPRAHSRAQLMSTRDRRVVVVTGAARRLGRALALDFAARGWAVALHVRRDDDDARSAVREVEAAGGEACVFPADFTDQSAVETLLPTIDRLMGPATCLINNASVFDYDDIASLTSDIWNRHFAVNVKAPVFLAKAFAVQCPKSSVGTIVNIIDQRVWKPTPHFLSYAGSKSALWAMTQTLAQALAPSVRVNAIGPGPMLRSIHQSEKEFAEQAAATPLQRETRPEEIAAAIRFIIDAPAMTGQMIALDGGQHLAWQTPDIGNGRG
jgi:NAD(P)-dependent dehydrogenase (short-subunit alcohol dehydrogenase family)